MLNKKFGIYNFEKNVFLSAKHQKHLIPLDSSYFVSDKNGLKAIVNLDNDFVTDYEFQQVETWNDSISIVKKNGKWELWDIKNAKGILTEIDFYEYLYESQEEKIILITRNNEQGVISNMKGEIVSPTFNDIYNVGSEETPIYFAEKYVSEAEFYIAIYYDNSGEIIRKQVFTEQEYDKIYCVN